MHLVLICLFLGCSISYLHKNFAPYDGQEEKMTQIFGVKAGFLLSKKYIICAKNEEGISKLYTFHFIHLSMQ